jgi:uncharacterized membrane protein YuzA (DUF378 family)
VANWGRSGTVEWNLINHRFGQNFTDLENRIAMKIRILCKQPAPVGESVVN